MTASVQSSFITTPTASLGVRLCMPNRLLITLALLNRNITARLANLRKHIRSKTVLELHGSRKFGAKHQGIESALVDEDHQLGAFRWGSIFTQTTRKFDAVFHSVKCVNWLSYSTSYNLVPQHITDILCSVLKMYVIYWYNTGV